MANFMKFTFYVPCQYFPAHGRLPPKMLMSISSNCDTQPLLLMLEKYLGSIHTHIPFSNAHPGALQTFLLACSTRNWSKLPNTQQLIRYFGPSHVFWP